MPYYFIEGQQAEFYTDRKLYLMPGEMLVTADFSENYYFII